MNSHQRRTARRARQHSATFLRKVAACLKAIYSEDNTLFEFLAWDPFASLKPPDFKYEMVRLPLLERDKPPLSRL